MCGFCFRSGHNVSDQSLFLRRDQIDLDTPSERQQFARKRVYCIATACSDIEITSDRFRLAIDQDLGSSVAVLKLSGMRGALAAST